MGFLDEYKVTTAPKATRSSAQKKSPEEIMHSQMASAIAEQKKYLESVKDGKSVSFERNGKTVNPRLFWEATSTGFLFTPRFGNQFLFPKGQGISVADHSELAVVMEKFAVAVAGGEFDARLKEILQERQQGKPRGRKAKVG